MAFASLNLTVAVLDYQKTFTRIEGNRIVGMLGSVVDRHLVHKKR